MEENSGLRVVSRGFRSDDFWLIRDLLIQSYLVTPCGLNWDVRRWDGARFHNENAELSPDFASRARIWQTAKGRLVAAAHTDGPGQAIIQIHPAFRHLEDEIIAWAEEQIAAGSEECAATHVDLFVWDYDAWRRRIVQRRGYEITEGGGGTLRRLRFGVWEPPAPSPPPEYTVRTTRPDDPAECQQIADLLNASFGRTCHAAGEYRRFVEHAPSFHPDLDLTAEAPSGELACYVGIAYDQANRHAVFEPVCTHPAHRRRGLARALMLTGLHLLRELGAIDVTVDTGSAVPANRLYDSVGFAEVYRGHRWRRIL